MSPDRELSNNVKKNTIAKFNTQMEKNGKPWLLKYVKGPAMVAVWNRRDSATRSSKMICVTHEVKEDDT